MLFKMINIAEVHASEFLALPVLCFLWLRYCNFCICTAYVTLITTSTAYVKVVSAYVVVIVRVASKHAAHQNPLYGLRLTTCTYVALSM